MDDYNAVQISPTVDFSPGANLGFIEHNDRIWFDATDEIGTQLWSTDGVNTWKETNISGGVSSNDNLLKHHNELVLNHQNGIAIFAESETWITGNYDNLSSVNGKLLHTGNGLDAVNPVNISLIRGIQGIRSRKFNNHPILEANLA